ncbi:MAG: HAD-IA family hydrolase [Bacteroidales bacterium]|nr:HAD-IA family hydrolase [Bacteroidales bacterium]
MTKLIVFDFDGTLGDTLELILKCNHETRRRMGAPVIPDSAIISTIGIPLWDGIKEMNPGISEADIPAWMKMYREVFDGLKHQIVPVLFPGVKETLAGLHNQGIILTVASSRGRESLNDFLKAMGIAPYFDYVLGAEDVVNAKPKPEPVLKTLKRFGVIGPECLVVGDMPVDIQMGLGAGAVTCGVTFGNSSREALEAAGANYVIDSFDKLLSII